MFINRIPFSMRTSSTCHSHPTSGSPYPLRNSTHSLLPYPIQGILFLLQHPSLLQFACCFIFLSVCVGLIFTLILFFILFPWQVHIFIKHFDLDQASASLLAFLCSVLEMAVLSFIYLAILPGFYLDRLFIRVLQLHRIETHTLTTWIRSCGRYARVAIGVRLCLGIGTLPLHFIPVIGSIAWAWTNGLLLMWEYHQFWFDTYELSFNAQKNWIFAHIHEYGNAGILAQILEMIPLFNWFFCWTNAIGSALMVVDWELRDDRPRSRSSPASNVVEQAQEPEQQSLLRSSSDVFDAPPPPYEAIPVRS